MGKRRTDCVRSLDITRKFWHPRNCRMDERTSNVSRCQPIGLYQQQRTNRKILGRPHKDDIMMIKYENKEETRRRRKRKGEGEEFMRAVCGV
jgi:hypothetical protein